MTAVMKKLRVQSHEVGEDCNFHRRRSRKNEDEAQFRGCNFNYRVRVKREDIVHEIPICRKAFMAVRGITRRRLMTVQKFIKSGVSPRDGRGQHGKLRKNYEVLIASRRYETYRTVFNTKFNIAFGYPRGDTCSACDKYTAEMKVLNARLSENNLDGDMKKQVLEEINKTTNNNKIHKLKAETFYTRKRNARLRSRKSEETEAICMDYQKNVRLRTLVPIMSIPELSVYSFNIHQLSDATSVSYTEDIDKKGANEVVSFLNHFVTNIAQKVRHLEIFVIHVQTRTRIILF
ncbi:hypothetical protein ANN_21531 [Periplaneta americana]|uniref:Uncharacterized protein n=1 Tax=Periplaneta americana TaxID=6978 RepID=A0ABQ8S5R5_PERAM|nr:hypothetical protein ANN_21531 [Periplaneta americana]